MSQPESHIAVLFLRGPFRAETSDGLNVTPTAIKAQALLVMLATAPRGSRSRAWLKSKLWSNRAPDQASGSLRQCLLQIRKTLGPAAHILCADRNSVSLSLKHVRLDKTGHSALMEGAPLFSETFAAWLSAERHPRPMMRRTPPAKPNTAPPPSVPRDTVSLVVDAVNEPEVTWFMQSWSDTLARTLDEVFSVNVASSKTSLGANARWTVRLSCMVSQRTRLRVRLSLHCATSGRHVWANEDAIPVFGAPDAGDSRLQSMCNQLVEAMADDILRVSENGHSADEDCRLALRELFKMQPSAAFRAEALLASAFDKEKRGLYLAWQAQCITIMGAERYSSDPRVLVEKAQALCRRALELEPNNSMVLATVANTQGQLLRQHATSFSLARRAVRLNPGNAMAWWALSSASVYTGDAQTSLKHAVQAGALVKTLPNKFWWDNQLFGSALASGKLSLALAFAEECHAQNPNFRPPLRYLIALYAHAERTKEAEGAVAKLQRLERDFSVDKLLNDRSYPASLIRKAPGLELDRIRAHV